MNARFQTTSWSLISRTRGEGQTAREATAALCQMYWQPLYVYARRAGQSEHEAQDTIQEFLLHVVQQDVFLRADADRGRFRTFLLSSLKQFMARRHRDENRQKRSPGTDVVSIDTAGAERFATRSAAQHATPDAAFEKAWALAQLDLAWQAVEDEYTRAGKAEVFGALRPVMAGVRAASSRELAAGLRMSEAAVNVALHRLRRRFGEALREQIATTLESTDDIEDEIALLQQSLSHNSG